MATNFFIKILKRYESNCFWRDILAKKYWEIAQLHQNVNFVIIELSENTAVNSRQFCIQITIP